MMWILGLIYCFFLWLVFAKLKLLKLSLPMAILSASIGPVAILVVLFCMQYFHPFSSNVHVYQHVVPVIPQMKQPGRVTEVMVQSNVHVGEGDTLFLIDPIPYEHAIEILTASVQEAKQSIEVAESSVILAKATIKRATADLKYVAKRHDRNAKLVTSDAISEEEFERTAARLQGADATRTQAHASLSQATLSVGLAKTKLQEAEAQLAEAQYDLQQTTVVAPGNGYVVNLQVRPGMLVGGPGAGSIMSFVLEKNELNRGVVVAAFEQKNFLRIKPGQYAEVALYGYPGEIYKGRVQTTIDIVGSGQLLATGDLIESLGPKEKSTFAVRILLDDAEQLRLPAGSQGVAAVYTDQVQVAGIPLMVIIRLQSWLNYVL